MEETLTVSELGALVRAALEQAMPYGVWVEGEIRSITRSRNGHVYFDLIEPAEGAGETPVATIPVVLFRENRDRVNRLLKRHGDPLRMTDGVRIRIQGIVDFYPPSGRLQLRMAAIDPTFTLGVIAAEREALLRSLSDEGLLDANACLPIPDVPLRVGVVTSLGSAAHADITTAFELSGHGFTLLEVDTAVQGAGAEASIALAIRAAAASSVDVVIVARGGGSKTDLAVFDHGEVARAIAMAAVPVLTGVGHDIDRSVADEVAHTSCTTPTAAAQAVAAKVDEWLQRLATCGAQLAHQAQRALDAADLRVDHHRRQSAVAANAAIRQADTRLHSGSGRLRTAAARAEWRAAAQLDQAAERLTRAGGLGLRAAELRLDTAQSRTRALDPAVALARGWTITRGEAGDVIRSADQVSPGDRLVTRFVDGEVESTVAD